MAQILLMFLLACGGASPEAQLEEANGHLAAAKFDAALTAADAGLVDAGAATAVKWQLELVRLEALARGNRGADAKQSLERLATAFGEQVKGTLYVSTANQLREAGDKTGAIEVIDLGIKRFPDDADLTAALKQTQSSASNDEKALLEQLGYLSAGDEEEEEEVAPVEGAEGAAAEGAAAEGADAEGAAAEGAPEGAVGAKRKAKAH